MRLYRQILMIFVWSFERGIPEENAVEIEAAHLHKHRPPFSLTAHNCCMEIHDHIVSCAFYRPSKPYSVCQHGRILGTYEH